MKFSLKHSILFILKLRKVIFIGIFTFILLFGVNAQKLTKIKGTVIDAKTKEPLPFVNIAFKGANVGTTTDFDGKYYIETQWGTTTLMASFVGYKTTSKKVELGTMQTINFQLSNDAIEIETFTVKADKKRYKNKNNPAVELIKLVIDHKDQNRKEALDFYEYDKYEKIEIDLNNITEDFLNKGWLKKKFQIVLDHIDTSEINGKPYLPVFLRETASKMYYRKKPKALKEHQFGTKMTGFEDYIDDDGMSFIMDKLYQDIDIYDNNIFLLSNQFTSPISILGPTIYKYFIIDTVDINGNSCINLAFTPRNKADFAFKGNLYVLNDSSTYAITKVVLNVPDEINLNFVKDLQLDQEYTLFQDSIWMLTKDKLVIDYNLTRKGRGMFGKKTLNYSNFVFNQKRENEIYNKVEKIVKEEGMENKTDSFWVENRPDTLSKQEEGVYTMIDSIQKIPAFKRTMDIAFLFITGWHSFGKIEVGPLNSFYSFNDIEGFRLRGGFRTTTDFSKKFMYYNYLAYGFKDKEYKYFIGLTYTFNKNFLTNPQHRVLVSYQHETNFPGQDLQFLNEDNFLLSFKRGKSDRMLFNDIAAIDYLHESPSGFSYNFIYENKIQSPLGALEFVTPDSVHYNNIKSDNFSLNLRFAPNEQYYQGKNFRVPLPNKYPIFQLRFTKGIKDFINGENNFVRLAANVFKRSYLAQIGYVDMELEGGKVYGGVPYPLLNLPKANQSFFLQEPSFNMMNFMEFLSDEYTTLNVSYYMNGFLFNRIPLFKRLKWREVISLKALYGNLTADNDPTIHPELMVFPKENDGTPLTYTFEKGKPYVEVSAGVMNIFKIVRIDVLQRLTYLDNPDMTTLFGVKGLGIRAKGKIDF